MGDSQPTEGRAEEPKGMPARETGIPLRARSGISGSDIQPRTM